MMKSKFTWAKEGNANTKLFHNLMNRRKARNAITKLERTNGELLCGQEDIVDEVIISSHSYTHPQILGSKELIVSIGSQLQSKSP